MPRLGTNGSGIAHVAFRNPKCLIRQLGRLDSFVTRQLINRGLGHLRPRVKKFIRAHHEIRLNFNKTRYIPKFDDLSVDEMIAELSKADGKPVEDFQSKYTEQQIRQMFAKLIIRQTRLLEKDLIEVTS
jgi:hypothetical protein